MKDIKVTASSGNVFADLGVPNPEEAKLKANLASHIHSALERHGWTQQQAAARLGVSQSDVSNIVRGKLRGFSIERLMRLLDSLGCEVRVVVADKTAAQEQSGEQGNHVKVPSTTRVLSKGRPNLVLPAMAEPEPMGLASVREG